MLKCKYNTYIENAQKQDSLELSKESSNAISIDTNTNIMKRRKVGQVTSGNVYMTGLPTT